jgi:hypothetical protein
MRLTQNYGVDTEIAGRFAVLAEGWFVGDRTDKVLQRGELRRKDFLQNGRRRDALTRFADFA